MLQVPFSPSDIAHWLSPSFIVNVPEGNLTVAGAGVGSGGAWAPQPTPTHITPAASAARSRAGLRPARLRASTGNGGKCPHRRASLPARYRLHASPLRIPTSVRTVT